PSYGQSWSDRGLARPLYPGYSPTSLKETSDSRLCLTLLANFGEVFLVGHLLQPVDDFAVERLLDRDMAHAGRCGGAVPVPLAGRTHDHVAGADFAFGAAPALHPAGTGGDDQSLAQRMGVPRGASARFEGHQRARHA